MNQSPTVNPFELPRWTNNVLTAESFAALREQEAIEHSAGLIPRTAKPKLPKPQVRPSTIIDDIVIGEDVKTDEVDTSFVDQPSPTRPRHRHRKSDPSGDSTSTHEEHLPHSVKSRQTQDPAEFLASGDDLDFSSVNSRVSSKSSRNGDAGSHSPHTSSSRRSSRKHAKDSATSQHSHSNSRKPHNNSHNGTNGVSKEPSHSSRNGHKTPKRSSADSAPVDIRFPMMPQLNDKIVLWRGDLTCLRVDAVVNSTNEKLNSENGVSRAIMRAAGPKLVEVYQNSERCRTGEANVCKGFDLFASYVIHTVGPRYNPKYRIAAENALHGCYRNVMELLIELKLNTVAFPVVNLPEKGYPPADAVHIVARTVRRFLEKYGETIKLVAFCVTNARDLRLYHEAFALYFPRSLEEQAYAQKHLPEYTGNEKGETVVAARKIRINAGRKTSGESRFNRSVFDDQQGHKLIQETEDPYSYFSEAVFTEMQESPDEIRRLADLAKSKAELNLQRTEREYSTLLKAARKQTFPEFHALKFIYSSGVDSKGRNVLVFVASRFPGDLPAEQLERLLMYIVKLCDALVNQEYVIVYLHTDINDENKPPFEWIRQSWKRLAQKYRENMRQMFLVHPTIWIKLVFWLATPMVKESFWGKLVYVRQLTEIFKYFDSTQLQLPEHCYVHDQIVNGSNWDESDGALAGHNRL